MNGLRVLLIGFTHMPPNGVVEGFGTPDLQDAKALREALA